MIWRITAALDDLILNERICLIWINNHKIQVFRMMTSHPQYGVELVDENGARLIDVHESCVTHTYHEPILLDMFKAAYIHTDHDVTQTIFVATSRPTTKCR